MTNPLYAALRNLKPERPLIHREWYDWNEAGELCACPLTQLALSTGKITTDDLVESGNEEMLVLGALAEHFGTPVDFSAQQFVQKWDGYAVFATYPYEELITVIINALEAES